MEHYNKPGPELLGNTKMSKILPQVVYKGLRRRSHTRKDRERRHD